MLDNILELVKGTVSGAITGNSQVPEAKRTQAIETTADAVTDGLKQNFSLSNIGDLMSLFGGSSSTQKNPITSSIENTVTNALVQKVGLSKAIAAGISSAVVPLVMNAISGKVNDPKEKGFSLEGLIESFSGKGDNDGGGLLGKLGGLFK
ncbi:hypothetical protein [Bacteroides sp. 519]|uniref:hypothetical protein n=1 Tax=Bacteroides sp. 519 TaxID=2302937 RepID=UPI0013D7A196|nr:hypothetical protein [Bacteroides sp. 519]NDV57899.1 hypothetical protein [Bacteroides sp. 519]